MPLLTLYQLRPLDDPPLCLTLLRSSLHTRSTSRHKRNVEPSQKALKTRRHTHGWRRRASHGEMLPRHHVRD